MLSILWPFTPSFPSFSASFETSLVQPFTQLGVTEAFDTRRANFSEITDKEGLAVTNIFHKALIEVNTPHLIMDNQSIVYLPNAKATPKDFPITKDF